MRGNISHKNLSIHNSLFKVILSFQPCAYKMIELLSTTWKYRRDEDLEVILEYVCLNVITLVFIYSASKILYLSVGLNLFWSIQQNCHEKWGNVLLRQTNAVLMLPAAKSSKRMHHFSMNCSLHVQAQSCIFLRLKYTTASHLGCAEMTIPITQFFSLPTSWQSSCSFSVTLFMWVFPSMMC